MIRLIVLVSALALAQPAFAQPASPPAAPAAKPAAAKPVAGRPAAKKSARRAANPAPAAHGPCIGVVSALGDRFWVQKVGFTVFGNDRKEISVPSWGLDDIVVARVRAAAGPRVAVKRIRYARDAFERAVDPRSLVVGAETDLTAAVKAAAGSGGCARYVAVVPFSGAFGGTNQMITGIGAVHYGFGNGHTDVYALTRIRVYDGRDFSVLKRTSGARLPANSFGSPPSRELEGFTWPENPQAVAAATRDAARAVLAESLDRTLPELLAP